MYSPRNYRLLLSGQFLGAFGDNALLALLVGQLTYLQQEGAITPEQLRTSSTVFASLLFVPYVVLAPLAGYFNDRHSKTQWLAGGNLLKLAGALLCAWGASRGFAWQGAGYLLVGVGACVYGPAKYGILPEILPREALVRANGWVELLTLVAILTGAIGGAILSHEPHAVDDATRLGASVAAQQDWLPARSRLPLLTTGHMDQDSFHRWLDRHRPEVVIGFISRVYDWILATGRRVPEDVAFAALTVIPSEAPQLTGVLRQEQNVGSTGVDALIAAMGENEWGQPRLRRKLLLEPSWHEGRTLPRRE